MENFSRPLVDWYKKEARPLPWREEPTPYRVWVSEIMLQQTRIEAAREYFNRFTRAFPTVEALAAAELDDVLNDWMAKMYQAIADKAIETDQPHDVVLKLLQKRDEYRA